MYIVVLDAQPNARRGDPPDDRGRSRTFNRDPGAPHVHAGELEHAAALHEVSGRPRTSTDTDVFFATITHAASGGGFGGVAIASVAVAEEDNDTPGVTVSQTYLNIPEGESRLLHGGARTRGRPRRCA